MKIADFKSQDEMQKMTIPQIKAHVREYNDHYAIRGYSKLNKSQLISEVLTAQQRIRNAGKSAPKVADPAPKKVADPRKRAIRQKELMAMKKPQLVEMVLPSDRKKTKQEIINLILKEENL